MANKYKNKDIVDDKIIKLFGSDYIKILTALLKKYDKKATGALINSLDYRLQKTANDIKIIIEANDYIKFVDEGRKRGSYPPIQAISKWAKVKGIPQSAVFPIAKKIFKFGIKPTNVIQQTTKEFETSQTLTNKYETEISKNLEEKLYLDIQNELNKIK